jgi:hypothetical protein
MRYLIADPDPARRSENRGAASRARRPGGRVPDGGLRCLRSAPARCHRAVGGHHRRHGTGHVPAPRRCAFDCASCLRGSRRVTGRRKGFGSRFPSFLWRRDDDPERLLDEFLASGGPSRTMDRQREGRPRPWSPGRSAPSLIALGASTGGVSALETVLTAFPADCPPTLVVQHIRAGFVDGMIRRLDGRCLPRIVPAEDAQRLQPGHVYIAHDPRRHLVVQPASRLALSAEGGTTRHGHRPSVDALFESSPDGPGSRPPC